MGAIQDSINSMITTTAMGVAGAKHAFDRAADKVAAAKEGEIKAAEELPELRNQVESAQKGAVKASSDENILKELGANPEAMKGPEDVKAFEELAAEVNRDKKMAEVALQTASNKIAARKEMLDRFDKTIRSKGWR